MINYKDLPNELKEKIFLNSIKTLQDLQRQCKVNKQYKFYCDKYFTKQIVFIMEAISNIINITSSTPSYSMNMLHTISIFTNSKNNLIESKGDIYSGIHTVIYTKFNYINILIDILKHIKTQNQFNYDILYTSHANNTHKITISSKDQGIQNIPEYLIDYIEISIQ
jgi:hypothetical protein